MTANALTELATWSVAPALRPDSAPAGGMLAQLRRWAAAVRTDDASTPSTRASAPFADPRMLVIGLAAADAIVDDASGSDPIRALAIGDGDGDTARLGADAIDALVDEGADVILLVTGNQPDDHRAALALISVICRVEPAKLVSYCAPRIDTDWMAALAGLRDARRAAARHRDSPAFAAESLGSAALLSAAGAVLQAAARRTPVLLDGAVALGGALVAGALSTGAARWCATSATGALHEGPVLRRLTLVTTPALPGGGAPGTAAVLQLRAVQMALHVGTRDVDPTMPLNPTLQDPTPQEGP